MIFTNLSLELSESLVPDFSWTGDDSCDSCCSVVLRVGLSNWPAVKSRTHVFKCCRHKKKKNKKKENWGSRTFKHVNQYLSVCAPRATRAGIRLFWLIWGDGEKVKLWIQGPKTDLSHWPESLTDTPVSHEVCGFLKVWSVDGRRLCPEPNNWLLVCKIKCDLQTSCFLGS